MKRIMIAIAAVLLLAPCAFAQSGERIYRKYADADNVSVVYISPSMFRIIGRLPDLDVGDGQIDFTPIVRSLTGLYVIDSENPSVNDDLRRSAVGNDGYELLMEAREDKEVVRIYAKGNEQVVNGFIVFADEGDEVTYICLEGRMPRDEFDRLLSEQMRD